MGSGEAIEELAGSRGEVFAAGRGRHDAVELVAFGGEPAVSTAEFVFDVVESTGGLGVFFEPCCPGLVALFDVGHLRFV